MIIKNKLLLLGLFVLTSFVIVLFAINSAFATTCYNSYYDNYNCYDQINYRYYDNPSDIIVIKDIDYNYYPSQYYNYEPNYQPYNHDYYGYAPFYTDYYAYNPHSYHYPRYSYFNTGRFDRTLFTYHHYYAHLPYDARY